MNVIILNEKKRQKNKAQQNSINIKFKNIQK